MCVVPLLKKIVAAPDVVFDVPVATILYHPLPTGVIVPVPSVGI